MSTLPSVRVSQHHALKFPSAPATVAHLRRAQVRKSIFIICAVATLLVAAFGPLVLPSSTGIQPEAAPSTEWLADEVLGQDFELQFASDQTSPLSPIASPFHHELPLRTDEAPMPDPQTDEAKSTPVDVPLQTEHRRSLANCF